MITERRYPNIDNDRCEHNVGGTPLFPCGAYYVNTANLASGTVPKHWHTAVEAFFIPEGVGYLGFDDVVYNLRAGDGGFINANVQHIIFSDVGRDFVYKSVIFSPSFIAGSSSQTIMHKYITSLLECKALPAFIFNGEKPWHPEALRYVREAHRAMEEEPPCFELAVVTELTLLWKLLFENEAEIINLRTEQENTDAMRAKRIQHYMQEHMFERLTLSQLAAAGMVGERECQRCFQKVYGTPPMRYLQKMRVKEAARLLLATDLPITEISCLCGFDNASYFSKLFKRYMNCTPIDYRNNV